MGKRFLITKQQFIVLMIGLLIVLLMILIGLVNAVIQPGNPTQAAPHVETAVQMFHEQLTAIAATATAAAR